MDESEPDPPLDSPEGDGGRATLEPELVAEVLASFGLPSPTRLRTIERGSRRVPKVVVETPDGAFVLKRRRPGSAEAARFTAGLQRRLAASGCPVPRVRSTIEGDAVLERDGHTFELVEFIAGERYPRHPAAAASAGRTLVRLHEEMRNLAAPERLHGSYHDSPLVREVLQRLQERGEEATGGSITPSTLVDRYERAAEVAADWFKERPRRLVHGDYHPGNLICTTDATGSVRAVLDWEAVRLDLPQAEFAAAAVHFALPPSAVPAGRLGLDESLLTAFAEGFGPLRRDTAEIVPDLMIESVVADVAFLLDGGVRGERAARLGDTLEGLLEWIDRQRNAISKIVRAVSPR